MFVFFIANFFCASVYWYSHLANEKITLLNFTINVPEENPVKYFANEFKNVFPLVLSLSLLCLACDFFLNKKRINFFDIPSEKDTNLIKSVYNGDIKSFLLPMKSGSKRVTILLCGMAFVIFWLSIVNIEILYNKLYESEYYNSFIDFKSQSNIAFLLWAFVSIAAFQVMTGLFFITILILYIFTFHKQKALKIYNIEANNL